MSHLSKSTFLAFLCAISTVALAQDRRPALVSMNGVGTHGCGEYLEFRKSNNETMTYLYQQWAAGYMAGYSDAITKPGMTTTLSADLVTYTAWLDKWCTDDPLSTVSSGLIRLRTRLSHQK